MIKNDNFINIARAGLVIIVCTAITNIYYITKGRTNINNETIKTLYKIDSAIQKNDSIAGSIIKNWEPFVDSSLNQNDNYIYVRNNQHMIDSLSNVNDDLLDRAYSIVKREAVYKVPYRNTKLFTNYKYIPAVQSLSWKYYKNQKKIREFEKLKINADNFESRTRNYCDSIVITQLKQLQRQKDSLLRKKQEMIYMCQK